MYSNVKKLTEILYYVNDSIELHYCLLNKVRFLRQSAVSCWQIEYIVLRKDLCNRCNKCSNKTNT